MTHILDTGPIFKFLVTNSIRHLIMALGNAPISVPEAVEHELFDTPNRRPQFAKAPNAWRNHVPSRFKRVLPDKPTDELRALSREVYQREFEELYADRRDLGEQMAVLHAVRLARNGESVILVCDDEGGIARIKRQAQLLHMQHMRGMHTPRGRITHADTITLLRWAIQAGAFDSQQQLRTKYAAMVALDEALPRDLESTGLLKSPPWPGDPQSEQ